MEVWAMEVHFTPEQEAALSQIASHAGTATEQLVRDAALRLVEENTRFLAAVDRGIAAADWGEFIEEEKISRSWRNLRCARFTVAPAPSKQCRHVAAMGAETELVSLY